MVVDLCFSPGKYTLNVVISHGDSDHYNLAENVIKEVKKTYPTLNVNYILGGKKADYKGTFSKAKFPGGAKKMPKINCGVPGFTCDILTALKTSDTNANSIVLYIKNNHPTSNRSVILTGDATGDTTDEIIGKHKALIANTTILQASHHGADTHESNSVEWFEETNPEYVILSSGTHAGYGHPRQTIVKNSLKSPNLTVGLDPHLLQYHNDWSFIDTSRTVGGFYGMDTIGRASNDYLCGLTGLGLFSTASQGDIKFDFMSGVFTFTRTIASPITIYEVMKKFLKTTDKKETTSITFPSMDFTGGGLSTVDFSALISLIVDGDPAVGLEPIMGLVSCDLSRVVLSPGYIASTAFTLEVDKLISGVVVGAPAPVPFVLPSLQQLDLPITPIQKAAIQLKWTTRFPGLPLKGLRFIDY